MSEFLSKLNESWPPSQWCDVTVVVAVSGGADSVALLRGLSQLRVAGEGRLVAAHFNHKLRGAESDADQAFVQTLASEIGVELIVGKATTDLAEHRSGEGLEGAAREARYEFLAQAADQTGARYVATAHTADDQVETILHRIIRGTGLAGLAGIPRTRPLTPASGLIRPLLSIRRDNVLHYLAELHQDYCFDTSNDDVSLTRNRIRHELVPLLTERWNPHVHDAILRLSFVSAEAQVVIDKLVDDLRRKCLIRHTAESVTINASELTTVAPYLVRELLAQLWRQQRWPLQQMGFDEWRALAEMALDRDPGSSMRTFPGGIRAERKAGEVILTSLGVP